MCSPCLYTSGLNTYQGIILGHIPGSKIRQQLYKFTLYLPNVQTNSLTLSIRGKKRKNPPSSSFQNPNSLISQINNLDLRYEIIWKRAFTLGNLILYLSVPMDATISLNLMLILSAKWFPIQPIKSRTQGLMVNWGPCQFWGRRQNEGQPQPGQPFQHKQETPCGWMVKTEMLT